MDTRRKYHLVTVLTRCPHQRQLPGARTALAGTHGKYNNDTPAKSEISGKIGARGNLMSRGRRPLIALSEAKHIAEKCGEVRHFPHEPGLSCTLVLSKAYLIALVRIKRVERIRITPEWLEREAGRRSRSAPVHCIFARNLPRAPGLNAKRYVPVFPGPGEFPCGA
jgi:hypothetical protein